jgi:hypothetical protein
VTKLAQTACHPSRASREPLTVYGDNDEPLQPEDEPPHPEDEFFPSGDSDGYQFDSERYPSVQEGRARRRLRAHGLPEPSGGWVPETAVESALEVRGLKPGRREWQVNMRFNREQYAVLRKAADLFGATPTALARLLVNRGADAVVKAHWAELKALREPDGEG